jgi:hypothetical protein
LAREEEDAEEDDHLEAHEKVGDAVDAGEGNSTKVFVVLEADNVLVLHARSDGALGSPLVDHVDDLLAIVLCERLGTGTGSLEQIQKINREREK